MQGAASLGDCSILGVGSCSEGFLGCNLSLYFLSNIPNMWTGFRASSCLARLTQSAWKFLVQISVSSGFVGNRFLARLARTLNLTTFTALVFLCCVLSACPGCNGSSKGMCSIGKKVPRVFGPSLTYPMLYSWTWS